MTEDDVRGRDRVTIFDTTLRDGEQAPGFSMNTAAKVKLAQALEDLRVDVIEAGFAAASPGDMEAVAAVAEEVKGPAICSLARAMDDDIEAAALALSRAHRKRCHVFIATSPIHREAKLKKTVSEVMQTIDRCVRLAAREFDDIEFSAEDAIRTERDVLIEAMGVAIEAGATTLNVPDTVGYSTPEEIEELFSSLVQNVKGAEGVTFSAHCHNDLGMAVANSLAAVRGGARQIECAVNGIGERAGNCSLEEAVMAIRTRSEHYGVHTGVNTTQICKASALLCELTGNSVARNKAIVGRNAFAHEAGIHQHGMLANRETYEIMRPEDVGAETDLVLGKHSGKHALIERAKALGYDLGDNRANVLFVEFKRMADRVGEVSDAELLLLLEGGASNSNAGSA